MQNITTEDLSKVLHDMRMNIVKGGHFTPEHHKDLLSRIIDCPEEWGVPSEDVKDGAKHFQAMKSFIGIDGLMQVWAYQDFRDQIQKFQVENNISATQQRSITLCGQMLSYVDYDDQLKLLDEDLKVLKAQVPGICRLFRNSVPDDYLILESIDDETDKTITQDVVVTQDVIEFLSQSCDYAWIYKESHDWVPFELGHRSVSADRDPPDEITLSLKWGDPEDPKTARYFKAINLDRVPSCREYYEGLKRDAQ
jgi:hypothetical protein